MGGLVDAVTEAHRSGQSIYAEFRRQMVDRIVLAGGSKTMNTL